MSTDHLLVFGRFCLIRNFTFIRITLTYDRIDVLLNDLSFSTESNCFFTIVGRLNLLKIELIYVNWASTRF